jgi:type IV pilus assembly protein PilA
VFSLVIVVVAAIAGQQAAGILTLVGYLAIFVLMVMLTIQRSHDFDTSGWLSLLMFVPLVNLIFWFIPGSPGENRFGKRPPPNTVGVVLLACILPFVFVVGILAAIAIPAYQDYTIRAQVSEGLNMAVEPKAAVQEAFRRTRSAPVDRLAAGLSAVPGDSSGQYVASLDVAGGTILVTYGENANPMIAGRMLALQPYVLGDDTVVWRCAYGGVPSGGVAMDRDAPTSADVTDIETKYLPSACRR